MNVHELSRDMLRYHETGNSAYVDKYKEEIENIDDPLPYLLRARPGEESTQSYEGLYVIDVIRRIEANTKKLREAPPPTGDQVFDGLASRLKDTSASNRDTLQACLAHMNGKLLGAMRGGQPGLHPSMVQALNWLERQSSIALGDMSYEEQLGAFKQPWFREALIFNELTVNAGGFNETALRAYIEEVTNQPTAQKANELIARHTADKIIRLQQKYLDMGRSDWARLFWTANSTRQLSTMNIPKTRAETAVGRRLAKEHNGLPRWSVRSLPVLGGRIG